MPLYQFSYNLVGFRPVFDLHLIADLIIMQFPAKKIYTILLVNYL